MRARTPPRRDSWTALFTTSVARTVLVCLIASLFWAVAPVALGWHPTVVSSGSMLPRLHVGDVVISRPVPLQKLALGQVLLVHDPDHPDKLRMHRYVRATSDGRLVLRGDANRTDDSSPVAPAAVEGVGVLRVPYVGLPATWAAAGNFLALAGTGLGLIGLLVLATWYRTDPDRDPQPVPPRPRRRSTGTGTRPRRHRALHQASGQPAMRVRLVVGSLLVATVATTTGGAFAAPAEAATTGVICAGNPAGDGAQIAWPLDETTGSTAADTSGHGNSGAYSSSGVGLGASGPCPTDGAVTLDGSSGMITGSTAVPWNDAALTEEIWFATTTTRGGMLMAATVGSGVNDDDDQAIYLQNDGTLRFTMYSPNTWDKFQTVATSAPANDGAWHVVDATYDPATGQRIYLDGVLAGSNTGATDLGNAFAVHQRVGNGKLGGFPGQPGSSAFAGRVAGANRYPSALSAGLIQAHARHAFTGVTFDDGDQFTAAPYFTCGAATASSAIGSPFFSYPLAETSGTSAADSSGNGRTGTYRNPGGVTLGEPGPCPRDHQTAVTLDGTSGYISTDALTLAPAVMTESIWFRTTTTAGGDLMSFGDAARGSLSYLNIDHQLAMDTSGRIYFYVATFGGYTQLISGSGYNDGQWHLATGTLSAAGTVLYVDGQPAASSGRTTSYSYMGYWRIGWDRSQVGGANTTSNYFAGSVAQAAVWNAGLTADQVSAMYIAGTGATGAGSGTCAAAVSAIGSATFAYPLSEVAGTSVIDASGNGRNGTYYNTPTFRTAGPCPRDNETAVTLNGTNEFLSVDGTASPPQVFTESVWFRTTSSAGGDLLSFGDAPTGGLSNSLNRQLMITSDGRVVNHTDGTANPSSSAAYNDGEWHMATATMSAAGPRLYVDGTPVAGAAQPTSQVSFTGTWRLGGDKAEFGATSNYFAGSLAQAVVFQVALTSDQVKTLYTAGV